MATPRVLDRLTAQDLFMLWADDFGWSEDIGVLAILDGTQLLDSNGQVRIEAVRQQLEPRLPLVPRFRQLLYRPRGSPAPGVCGTVWAPVGSVPAAMGSLVAARPTRPPGGPIPARPPHHR